MPAFGRHGAAEGHFDQPEGDFVAFGPDGSLYVADWLAMPLGHRQILQFMAAPAAAQTIALMPGGYDVAVSGIGNPGRPFFST